MQDQTTKSKCVSEILSFSMNTIIYVLEIYKIYKKKKRDSFRQNHNIIFLVLWV